MGFKQISLSSVVMPMVKMVPRGYTASADAYLTPHIMRYLQTFIAGFDDGLPAVQIAFMQSDGGLSPVEGFSGHKVRFLLLSTTIAMMMMMLMMVMRLMVLMRMRRRRTTMMMMMRIQ